MGVFTTHITRSNCMIFLPLYRRNSGIPSAIQRPPDQVMNCKQLTFQLFFNVFSVSQNPTGLWHGTLLLVWRPKQLKYIGLWSFYPFLSVFNPWTAFSQFHWEIYLSLFLENSCQGKGPATKSDDFLEKFQRGGRVIFNPKIYIADFGNFKQGFLSMKLIKRRVISGYRVCFFNNCIDINWY